MQYIKECFDIREALRLDKYDNFDVLNDTEDLLQVRCKEGRFVVEVTVDGNLVSLLQGNEILIWLKKEQISIGNDFVFVKDGVDVKCYFEDLSNLIR